MNATQADNDKALRRRCAVVSALALLLTAGCGSLPTSTVHLPDNYTGFTARDDRSVCNTPNKIVKQSIVRVATSDGGDASGVVVAPDRVLTAAHVVYEANVALVRIDDTYHQAQVLALDQSADLALLAVHTSTLKPLPLSHKTLYESEQVWAIGYPFALDQVTTHGIFRNRSQGRLFTSAPIQAGTSGGGLMRCENGNFELAGIIRGYGGYRVGDELIPLHDLSIHTPAERIQQFVLQVDGVSL